ncbi:hypothetical protein Patl1_20625 [Pistacia atlantica]|uniref:Uncharacterized protein n=1 Tax=Pistacia atlantica TaxID=434234 RepID=A0ACC1BKX2_9ROSI|nr:hypothetical protein Patl1_20625 [Pistacia atlantica]
MAELINRPEVFKKLRDEIELVVGFSRLVKESDVQKLPYLQAIVKESLRLHPPAPIVFRECITDCKIKGFDVKAKTKTLGQDFRYLPYVGGRRGCSGAAHAHSVMHATIAALVQCFDWKVKGGEKIDIIVGSGFSGAMATRHQRPSDGPWENSLPSKSLEETEKRDQFSSGKLGTNRLVKESDIPNLPYLRAVIREALRLHPSTPLIIRECAGDCKVNGYTVKSKDRVVINVYIIMRDPDSWANPDDFMPERFLESSEKIGEH